MGCSAIATKNGCEIFYDSGVDGDGDAVPCVAVAGSNCIIRGYAVVYVEVMFGCAVASDNS